MPDKEQEAIVLMRFGEAVYQTCVNGLTKQLSVTQNYGGQVLGTAHADQIKVLEGHECWPEDKGVAVLHFPTVADAKRWEHSTPEIRQNDWLAGVDIIISPCMCTPKSGTFLQLISFEADEDKDQSPDEAAKRMPELMRENCVIPTVSTKCTERVRGSWFTHHFIVNQYACAEAFQHFGQLDEVRAARDALRCRGWFTVVAFQLQPLK